MYSIFGMPLQIIFSVFVRGVIWHQAEGYNFNIMSQILSFLTHVIRGSRQIGPQTVGPRTVGPRTVGPGAQLSTSKKRTAGPRTIGPLDRWAPDSWAPDSLAPEQLCPATVGPRNSLFYKADNWAPGKTRFYFPGTQKLPVTNTPVGHRDGIEVKATPILSFTRSPYNTKFYQ